MNRVSSEEFSKTPEVYLRNLRNKGERIVLFDESGDSGVLVSMADAAILEKIEDLSDIEAAHKALKEVETTGSIPYAQARKELGLD